MCVCFSHEWAYWAPTIIRRLICMDICTYLFVYGCIYLLSFVYIVRIIIGPSRPNMFFSHSYCPNMSVVYLTSVFRSCVSVFHTNGPIRLSPSFVWTYVRIIIGPSGPNMFSGHFYFPNMSIVYMYIKNTNLLYNF